MRTSIVSTIFRKELKEVIRDKRMLFLIIFLPFFLYPVLFAFMGKMGKSSQERLAAEKVNLVVNPEATQTPIYNLLRTDTTWVIESRDFSPEEIDTLENTVGLYIDPDYANQIGNGASAKVEIFGDQSRDIIEMRMEKLEQQFKLFGDALLRERLEKAELEEAFAKPLDVYTTDLASKEQKVGRVLGLFLPMVLLLFTFTGCIYIAIDVTAGEKERRTLQTLFTAPISTREIIAGKFLAVFSIGLLSAVMNVLSLLVAMQIQVKLLGGSGMSFALTPVSWVWILVILILSTIFLAALCLAIILLANSYKEAQTYVSPLMMMILIPSILVQMPGFELNVKTAMIPIANIALALKSILQGTAQWWLIAIVAGFIILYALIALWLASRIFNNESVITGEKVNMKEVLLGTK